MIPNNTRLDLYNNSWYKPGGGPLKRLVWYFVNVLVFNHGFFPVSGLKVALLRLFGAKIGKGVVIKPSVNIKYPWNLSIGDYAWIGEEVWIDNLAQVDIGAHCCLSQGCLLLCGNHDYSRPTFDLRVSPITLEEGAWAGARSILAPGSRMGTHAVLAAGSVASFALEPWTIYQGNPAKIVRSRKTNSPI
jgi:putative colanic acid biosynthesis acetyltransferase WcaF